MRHLPQLKIRSLRKDNFKLFPVVNWGLRYTLVKFSTNRALVVINDQIGEYLTEVMNEW